MGRSRLLAISGGVLIFTACIVVAAGTAQLTPLAALGAVPLAATTWWSIVTPGSRHNRSRSDSHPSRDSDKTLSIWFACHSHSRDIGRSPVDEHWNGSFQAVLIRSCEGLPGLRHWLRGVAAEALRRRRVCWHRHCVR